MTVCWADVECNCRAEQCYLWDHEYKTCLMATKLQFQIIKLKKEIGLS